ncbi:MAG: HemK/PrmC family methyltransferase, partial [Nocardioides sp.]
MTGSLASLITEVSARLAEAQVPSPQYDAQELVALALGMERKALLGLVTTGESISLTPEQAARLDDLVARRSARVPLQHLTGSVGFRHVELAVGPGVFVPRPETELLAGWAIEQAAPLAAPVVVDLCTGSGAIAKSVADEVPQARVYAVELGDSAHAWAARNLAGTGVELRHGDMAEAFDELAGTVDVVVSNPPYVPLEAWESG